MTVSERTTQRQKVAKLLESGRTMAEIANTVKVSRQTVSKWARQMGFKPRPIQVFAREIHLLECVIDETAAFWASLSTGCQLEELTATTIAIADILAYFPKGGGWLNQKQYKRLAAVVLSRVTLLRILVDYSQMTKDRRKLIDAMAYIEQITISILSLLAV